MRVEWGRIRAVCFDMDGTLVDSDAAWLRATRKAFDRFGLELTDEQYEETLGLDNASGVRRVLPHFPQFKQDPVLLVEALEEEILAEFRGGMTPMPGAEELLARWKKRWPLALVSTSSEALIEAALEGLGWKAHFKVRLSSETVGPSKPDPAVYREAARRLGAAPPDCLALEDSLNGVKSAHAAGMQVIGITRDAALTARLASYTTSLVPNLLALP